MTFIAETMTGALAVGKTGVLVSGGRIVQGLLKGRLFKQWAAEFKWLRNAGRIPDDFAEQKYGFQTWVELMTIIDEESPDPDRLEALKSMFFAVNRTNAQDAERITACQLWQITKRLNSGELVLLKAIYQLLRGNRHDGSPPMWNQAIGPVAGFTLGELIEVHQERLEGLRLVKTYINQGAIHQSNRQLTHLGEALVRNIETYQTVLKEMDQN